MKTAVAIPIRVKIVHRNRIFRECLAEVLSEGDRFAVTQVDHTEDDFLADILAEDPHVVLIDLNLPEQLALELTRRIQGRGEECDSPRVVLLSHASPHEDLVDCFAAGAHGCVLEESSLDDLRDAIVRVASGQNFCSHGLVHAVFHRLAHRMKEPIARPQRDEEELLTARELEIVGLIAEHLSNKQIAKRLAVSLNTVKNHVHNIVEKLQVTGRYEAVDYARRQRWLAPGEKLKR